MSRVHSLTSPPKYKLVLLHEHGKLVDIEIDKSRTKEEVGLVC